MTVTIRNPYALKLYTLAVADESALQYPLPDHLYGFAAQQSCEKFLKALLTVHACKYPLTHNFLELTDLLQHACQETLPGLPYSLRSLQPYAVVLRYDYSGNLADPDRVAVRDTVALLRQHVLQRILAIERASPSP